MSIAEFFFYHYRPSSILFVSFQFCLHAVPYSATLAYYHKFVALFYIGVAFSVWCTAEQNVYNTLACTNNLLILLPVKNLLYGRANVSATPHTRTCSFN